ncbi:MAG: UbiA family prenyltransferase [Candidatus Nitrosocosmicus sp.]
MLKDYLQLFRVPNIFTVPPDILGGYFVTAINNVPSINYFDAFLLVFSSIFLYVGGLVTNDLFDIHKDKIERPNRPLSSGKIKKSTAVLLSALFFGVGVFLSSLLTLTSTLISVFLVVMILLYNYKLKNGLTRPFLMGGIRSLNVIYGASCNMGFLNSLNEPADAVYVYMALTNMLVLAIAVFIHVFTLTFLSTRETQQDDKSLIERPLNLKRVYVCYLLLFTIIYLLGVHYLPNKLLFSIFFVSFLLLLTVLFYNKIRKRQYGFEDAQFLVKNMIVLLIALDSSFVAGSSGIYFGILSIGMIIPCVITGKKVQMT